MVRLNHVQGFAEVYDEHVWDVYGFIAYRVRTRDEAEDLTQATFERALKAWSRFDPSRASAHTWLLAIARNLVIDHYRSDKSRLTSSLDAPGANPPDQAAIEGEEEQRLGPDPALASALDGLPQRQREILALRFGGDLSGAQIAEITGLNVDNVQQILSRTLRQLRDELAGTDLHRRSSGGFGITG